MKFRDYFNVKQIVFAVAIIALVLIFAYASADKLVEVDFTDTTLRVVTDPYVLSVDYAEIESAQLADRPEEPGQETETSHDTTVLLYGQWVNEQWGEYTACIDCSSDKCIVLKLTDGQTYVFSRKSGKVTEEVYQELLTHIG